VSGSRSRRGIMGGKCDVLCRNRKVVSGGIGNGGQYIRVLFHERVWIATVKRKWRRQRRCRGGIVIAVIVCGL
jgi:hypothetical protein